MIIKDIKRNRKMDLGATRFASSIQYSQLDKSNIRELRRKGFEFSIGYSINDKFEETIGERVVHSFAYGVASIETSIWEMDAVSRISICRDPVLHAVISYNSAHGENPTFEQIESDVETLLRARGYIDAKRLRGSETDKELEDRKQAETNQHVAFVHGDTDHLHVHVIANRVSRSGYAASNNKNYVTNERTAAKIAQQRGWSIVVGNNNFDMVSEQALKLGATADEIKALANKEYPSLKHLRSDQQNDRLIQERIPARSNNQREFCDDYSAFVQSRFSQSTSMKEFRRLCLDGGLLVKFRVKAAKSGQGFPTLAFTDLEDKTGQSGTKLGVSAKDLIEKFGAWNDEWLRPIKNTDRYISRQSTSNNLEELTSSTEAPHVPASQRERSAYASDNNIDEKASEAKIATQLIAISRHSVKINKNDLSTKWIYKGEKRTPSFWEGLRLLRQARKRRKGDFKHSAKYESTQRAFDKTIVELSRERRRIRLLWKVTPVKDANIKRLLRRHLALDAKAEYAIFKKKFKDNEVYEDGIKRNATKQALRLKMNARLAAARLRALIDRQFYGKEYAKDRLKKQATVIRDRFEQEYAAAKILITKQQVPTFVEWLKVQRKTQPVLAALDHERESSDAKQIKQKLKPHLASIMTKNGTKSAQEHKIQSALEIFEGVHAKSSHKSRDATPDAQPLDKSPSPISTGNRNSTSAPTKNINKGQVPLSPTDTDTSAIKNHKGKVKSFRKQQNNHGKGRDI